MSREVMLPTRDSDVNELFRVAEVLSQLEEALVVVFPFQHQVIKSLKQSKYYFDPFR
jgi:hypothetical protein